MESSIGYLIAIVVFVLALNLYFTLKRIRSGTKYKRMGRAAVEEAKQALWRDNEVQRRIDREQDDAYERVQLKNETLAIYEEVRRRAEEREREGIKRVYVEPENIDNDPTAESSIERFR